MTYYNLTQSLTIDSLKIIENWHTIFFLKFQYDLYQI